MGLASLILSTFVGLASGLASTDTITWGGDNTRAGYLTNHNMDPAVVRSSEFDQLFKTALPGNYKGYKEQIYSQPLVYTPSGEENQYVYFSTTQNNVYKLDAKTGQIVASRSLHIPFLTADLDGCVDINPTVGIIGTGVIDPDDGTLYLAAKTYENQESEEAQGRPAGRYFIHALDVNDLSERSNFPIKLEGTVARNSAVRSFNGGILLQRPGLLHTGGFFYAAFGSHCVQYDFTGWIIGWDKSGNIVEKWATEGEGVPETTRGAGIWMSGGALASNDAGDIYFATGNGYASQLSTIPVAGFDPPTAMEEAAVHMTQGEDGSLSIVDFFMPWEKEALDGADKDLGTSPLQILPKQFSCGDVSRIGVVTGKSGKTYWLNLDDLGGYRNGKGSTMDDIIQVYQNENSVYAGAGVYPLEGGYIYINVIQYPTHVFKFSCSGGVPSFAKVADSPNNNAYTLGVSHGTVTTLNGEEGTGLLWNTDVQNGNLRIYDAVPEDGKLNLIKSFDVTGTTKFTRAVFGDGIIYMGTTEGYVYGFGSPTTLPLNCTSGVDFGDVDVAEESAEKEITCTALIGVTVSTVKLEDAIQFSLSSTPNVPLQVAQGSKFTIKAKFKPTRVGVLSDNIVVDTTNGEGGYSKETLIRLKGTGESSGPLLSISPETVVFNNVITGNDPNGVTENVFVSNEGRSTLTVTSVEYSTTSADGPFETWTGSGNVVFGKFTLSNVPSTIASDSTSTVTVLFDSSTDGDFVGWVKFKTDGGNGYFAIQASSGAAPVALLEFQTPDGEGWVTFEKGKNFTFGDVLENTSRSLKLRVTNNVAEGGVSMSLTVSKPPYNIDSIVRAVNQQDLAEGTILAPGESATAVMICAVPKSQINVDPYSGTAPWTMNINDPDFSKQTMRFNCEAVAEQAPPLLENGQGKFRYAGCFKENNPDRQLDTQLYGNDAGENFMCIEACENGDYIFCGTQYHRECWAGNTIPNLKVDDDNCNYDCAGDINQICGGNGVSGDGAYISLFADSLRWDGNTTTPEDPDEGGPYVNPGVLGYRTLGCYKEPDSGRALSQQVVIEASTVAKCIKACDDDEFRFAGLEYGGECWCGNTLNSGSLSAPQSECSMTCKGNSTEYCGGSSRLNLYMYESQTNGTQTSSDSTPTGTSASLSNSVSATATTATTTTASATATSTPDEPSVKDRVGNWVFQDCWTESNDGRVLSDKTLADDDMTLEMCGDYCSGLKYFGIEYGRECYCGDTLKEGSSEAEDASTCSLVCSGDETTYCGGSMRLQLYKYISTVTSPTNGTATATSTTSTATETETEALEAEVVKKVGDWYFEACWVESDEGRVLSGKTLADDDMTLEMCGDYCDGLKYFGIEYGRECYCGDSLEEDSAEAEDPDDCSFPCPGDESTLCGGSMRLQLYKYRATNATATTSSTRSATLTSTSASVTSKGSSASTSASSKSTGSVSTSDDSSSTVASGKVAGKTDQSSTAPSTTLKTTKSSASSTKTSTSASSTPTGPIIYSGNRNFTYYSCVQEPSSGKLMDDQIFNDGDDMTIKSCLERCWEYDWAGVEYGRECWCGNTLNLEGNDGATPGKNVTDSKCSFLCPGDDMVYCGASSLLSLYINKDLYKEKWGVDYVEEDDS